jgi:hypothetical protein
VSLKIRIDSNELGTWFRVVGISEDMHPEAWLKAIKKHSLQNWHYILSGRKKGFRTGLGLPVFQPGCWWIKTASS